jgi:RNA polymerase sigma-70 factor (ECF subfamily)
MILAQRQPGLEQDEKPARESRGWLAGAEKRWPAHKVNESVPPEVTPEELARLSAQGSAASFEQLVLRFQSHIYNFLYLSTRHRQDAEDLTQETFCRAWRGLHGYNPSLSFAPWLFAIARHTAVSHFRSAEPLDELPPDAGIVEENPANLLADKDSSAAVWQLARTLKPKYWEVLWFRYGEGFSTAETARAMRTNVIHAKVLLHRARAEMARRLTARGYGPPPVAKPSAPETQPSRPPIHERPRHD